MTHEKWRPDKASKNFYSSFCQTCKTPIVGQQGLVLTVLPESVSKDHKYIDLWRHIPTRFMNKTNRNVFRSKYCTVNRRLSKTTHRSSKMFCQCLENSGNGMLGGAAAKEPRVSTKKSSDDKTDVSKFKPSEKMKRTKLISLARWSNKKRAVEELPIKTMPEIILLPPRPRNAPMTSLTVEMK